MDGVSHVVNVNTSMSSNNIYISDNTFLSGKL